LATLFNKIYKPKHIPEQWLFGKVFIKDIKMNVENYRLIANPSSTSKIFEKLILQRIIDQKERHNIDITHKSHHGFR
jgi:hypothetical protein